MSGTGKVSLNKATKTFQFGEENGAHKYPRKVEVISERFPGNVTTAEVALMGWKLEIGAVGNNPSSAIRPLHWLLMLFLQHLHIVQVL